MDKSEYAHDSFASGSGNLPLSIDEYSTHYPPSGNTTTFSNNHESYATYSSTDRSPETIPTLFGHLHQQFQFQSPAAIEVDKLKDNLYRTRSWKKSPPDEFRPQQPSTKCQFPSAISSRSAPFYHSDRWPNDSSDSYRSLQTRAKRNSSGDAASASPNYDFSEEEDMKMKDEKSLKRLRIYDTYISGGHKRRAASPNDEHMSWRRESSSYDSPQDHFASPPRPNSYPSTMSTSMHPTSITTANSSAQCLLVGPSPAPISHSSWNSPDTATVSADLNLPTSISNQGLIHPRNISSTSTFKITEAQELRETKLQGLFVCECCPRKPKRFGTLAELITHKAEKPYKCAFCRNYFKNQGDVERHKKSTHGRLSSWSCSALSGYESASHESTDRPGQADTCGYCGDEFPRSGCGPDIGVSISGNVPQTVTDHDRGERLRHLEEVHNFRKCKSSAKFPRADNFREHLKRIHAGTSGKWINVLINVCMLKEGSATR
ncbi:hypothetical protein FOC4_g10000384 [Fusarium odoratissimum]|uniref:C2H2-type domain-containing protein n=1 Tax=Fusarium oxysporum f. sp. cubense (strain race 4) TaxID=2502994 RepID=N1RT60_FUSC4|nr:hypothetical protein FOC4_g10000384 [Fusarium odoratissimum]